jgi:hypothetical protein
LAILPWQFEAADLLKSLAANKASWPSLRFWPERPARGLCRNPCRAFGQGRDVGDLANSLVTAWAKVGEGKMSEALAEFDTLTKKPRGWKPSAIITRPCAWRSVGDFQGADAILSGKAAGPIFVMRRGVLAHAQILSQLERNADALALLDKSFGTAPIPVVDADPPRLASGRADPLRHVTTARDGIAEVFYHDLDRAERRGGSGLHPSASAHRGLPAARSRRCPAVDRGCAGGTGPARSCRRDLCRLPAGRPDLCHRRSRSGLGAAGAGQIRCRDRGAANPARSHGDLLGVQFALADLLRSRSGSTRPKSPIPPPSSCVARPPNRKTGCSTSTAASATNSRRTGPRPKPISARRWP